MDLATTAWRKSNQDNILIKGFTAARRRFTLAIPQSRFDYL